MTVTSVREQDTLEARVIRSILDADDDFIQSLKPTGSDRGENLVGAGFAGAPEGSFLRRTGDTMIGPLGNEHTIAVIEDGRINVSDAANNYSPFVYLNPQDGQADDLVNIVSGNPLPQQELWIQTLNQPITIKQRVSETSNGVTTTTGNIICPGNIDFVSKPGAVLKFIWSIVSHAWILVTTSDTTAGLVPTDYSDLGDQDGTASLNITIDRKSVV